MSPGADIPSWSATFCNPFSTDTLTIAIDADRVNHLVSGHVLNLVEQPAWLDFLGKELFDSVSRWTLAPGTDMAVPEAFARCLFAALEDPLQHPRLIEYTQLYDDGRPAHKTWEVVTRPGVVVVIRHTGDKSTISTGYIPESAVNEHSNRRWLGAMVARVEHYRAEILIEGRLFVVPPLAGQAFPSEKPQGSRTNLKFHLEKTWGFHALAYEGETLIVWKKPLPFGPHGPMPVNPLKPKNPPKS